MDCLLAETPVTPVDAVYELDAGDFDEARELLCYIKPIGPGLKLLRRHSEAEATLALQTAGTEIPH